MGRPRKLSDEDILQIQEVWRNRITIQDLMDQYKAARATIERALRKRVEKG